MITCTVYENVEALFYCSSNLELASDNRVHVKIVCFAVVIFIAIYYQFSLSKMFYDSHYSATQGRLKMLSKSLLYLHWTDLHISCYV